jgi:hypothetical protein
MAAAGRVTLIARGIDHGLTDPALQRHEIEL